jgi:hemolysin III
MGSLEDESPTEIAQGLDSAPSGPQPRGEEIANGVSHGLGLAAAIAAAPPLICRAAAHADPGFLVGASVFAATVVLLYLASTLYHLLPIGRAKRVFVVIDHSAIFLLIAGTYTPFTLGVLRGPWGWTLLALIWGMAAAGIALKTFDALSHPLVSTGLYLLMGWLVLVAINPAFARIPTSGLLWLAAGGVAYTAGVAFYLTDARVPYGHFVWHLFVLAGTACHYYAVFNYAA